MAPIEFRLLPDSATVGADGSLSVGGCSLLELAAQFGTPLFVYDVEHIRTRCREAVAAFGPGRVIYATKAFLCRAVARHRGARGGPAVRRRQRWRAARRARRRGARRGRASCTATTRASTSCGWRSPPVCGASSSTASTSSIVSTRCTVTGLPCRTCCCASRPGVHAHTHTYIATGQNDSKFGFNLANGDAERAARRAQRSSVGEPRRLPLPHRVERVRRRQLRQGGRGDGRVRRRLRPSGARPRRRTRRRLRRRRVGAVDERVGSRGARRLRGRPESPATVSVEPGRALVAGAAVTLYTVGTIKRIPGVRTYVAVDGGMSDNPRPVLYGSGYEAMLPRSPLADRPRSRSPRRQALRVGRHPDPRSPRARRHRRRRRAGRPGHRRLRALDGLQLQQGASTGHRVRRGRRRLESWSAGRRTTTCCSPTSGDAGRLRTRVGGILAGHDRPRCTLARRLRCRNPRRRRRRCVGRRHRTAHGTTDGIHVRRPCRMRRDRRVVRQSDGARGRLDERGPGGDRSDVRRDHRGRRSGGGCRSRGDRR